MEPMIVLTVKRDKGTQDVQNFYKPENLELACLAAQKYLAESLESRRAIVRIEIYNPAGKPAKLDYRIGLTAKPKYLEHPRHGEKGEVVNVLPNGTNGIVDKDGVLVIRMETGPVILAPADEWITA